MKLDKYTKIVLTVIAAFLGVIALGQVRSPQAQAAPAAPKFGSVAAYQGADGMYFFDSATGDLWGYKDFQGPVTHHVITELGKPMQ